MDSNLSNLFRHSPGTSGDARRTVARHGPNRLVSARAGSGSPRLVPIVLAVGALGVVLAGVESAVFDLERYQTPKLLVLHAVALGLLAAGAVRKPARGGPVVAFGLAFVAWSGLSGLLAENLWLALSSWGVSFSAVVVLAAAGAVPETARDTTAGWIVAAVVLGASLGVAQAYGWDAPWLASSRPPGGTFGNRNFLAHLSAIAAPALLAAAVAAGGRPVRRAALAGLAVVVLAIVLTRSRAAWLGSAAGLASTVMVLVARRRAERGAPSRRWRRALPASLAIASAAAGAALIPNALEWRGDSPYVGTLTRLTEFREGSGRGRLIQYRNSIALAAEHPVLGVGPGNWFVHYPRVTGAGDPAYSGHLPVPTNPWPSSDWVAFLTERGAPALLLLMAAGAVALSGGLGRGRLEPGAAGVRAAALVGVIVATLVTGLFDAVLLLPAPAYVTAALIGLMLPWKPLEPSGPTARWPRWAALAIALALVAHTAFTVGAIRATADGRDTATLARAARLAPWEHRLRLLLAERGRCADALAAVELMPHHPRPRELAAGCRRP